MLEHDSADEPNLHGWASRQIVRHRGARSSVGLDDVAEEMPVAIVFNGISHAVMMVTPCDLEAFAYGFALSEGIVDSVSQIRDIELEHHGESAQINVTLLQQSFFELKLRRRSMAGRSGCGICGIESLEALDLRPPRIAQAGAADSVTDAAIEAAARGLKPYQTLMQRTGGVHAAAWCERDGRIVCSFEDVGRHNALDKLIGHLARERTDFAQGFVFLSSRASYELVRKAARVGITMVATISAPTTLAIRVAEHAGIRLASFCREDSFVDYVERRGATPQRGTTDPRA